MLAAVIEGTTLVSRPPVSALQRFSGCFFSLAYWSGVCVQTLPDPSTYLIVEVPKVSAPRCVISGPRLKSVRSAPTEAMQAIGIRLRPGVVFLLTGVCAERWVGRRESLGELLGPCVGELAVRISMSPRTDAQFDLLESFLVARLEGKEVDGRVGIALHLIQRSRGAMRVSEIASRCGLSYNWNGCCGSGSESHRSPWRGSLASRLRSYPPANNQPAIGLTWLRSRTM
jgi:hypothetical protein